MQDQIEQLCLHWQRDEKDARSISTRLQVEHLLAVASLRPRALPSGSVFLVKRMSGIRLPQDLRRLNFAWEADLQQKMDSLYQQAVYPAHYPTPIGSNAIVFEDMVQLLTTFTRDVINSQVTQGWYWQAQFPTISATSYVSELLQLVWSEQAQWLPATLAHLDPHIRRQALKTLSPNHLQSLYGSLQTIFQVTATNEFLRKYLQDDGQSIPSSNITNAQAAPWSDLLSLQDILVLSPLHIEFLGTCLLLYHRPASLHTSIFEQQHKLWWHSQLQQTHEQADAVLPSQNPIVRSKKLSTLQADTPIPHDEMERTSDEAQQTDTTEQAPTLEELQLHPIHAEGIFSQLCGLFYLVNLLKMLHLPQSQALGLGAWAVIEGWGRILLANSFSEYQQDAIWSILSELDGRAEHEPIHCIDFVDYAIPSAWLNKGHEYHWLVDWHDGQLIIFDANDDYLVCLEQLSQKPDDTMIQSRLRDYSDLALEWSWNTGDINPLIDTNSAKDMSWVDDSAAKWFSYTTPFIATILRRMVHDDPSIALLADGWISRSRTHLDVRLPTEQIHLLIRKNGLDANPNWMPSLGYIIQFHFLDSHGS